MEQPDLPPEPPRLETSSSSFPPFTAARNRRKTVMQRIRRHRPRRNRSSDEAVRASRSYDDRARGLDAPPPEIVSAVVHHRPPPQLRRCRKSPPWSPLANFPVRRRRPPPSRPVTDTGKPVGYIKSISGQGLTGLTFDQRVDFSANLDQFQTDFCMPDCMRGYGQSVDRLDRSLVWSIKRLRAVTPSTLSELLFGLALSGSMDYGVASHTSLSDSPIAHPSLFPFSGFSPDVQQLGDVKVRQFSQELSVSSVIFEVIQEWICDVSATSPLQAIVPRVLLWRLCDVRYEPLLALCGRWSYIWYVASCGSVDRSEMCQFG
ncbi:hypothetical protein IGI04_035728 [Brassica rapa subsp. trilocularis]|uniref:Uncharacterized protein n=1 Tax=Brassica rapa subsp. trilocularis TaxID=1813537 RepID=A0ABQ7LCE6_BRACM|nr:hypothetical protein IGI04_035728 [Brassica rapa subsp. trilocularis]